MSDKDFDVVCYTPNGREIRRRADGRYEVQPHNDNYWLVAKSIEEALTFYHRPELARERAERA